MAKDMKLYPVSKEDGVYFGEADAGQIAASGGKLKLFDAEKARALKSSAEIKKEEAELEKKAQKVDAVKASGGADSSAVKKAPK